MLPPQGDMLFHHASFLKHGHDIKEGYTGNGKLVLLHMVDNGLVLQLFVENSCNRVPKIGLWIISQLEDVHPRGNNII